MRKLFAVVLVLAAAGQIEAAGLLIPKEKEVPPLAMVNHNVTITIEDQVAVTLVEQTFRNHTDRKLEATYIFPVPKDASVQKFAMWVDGKKVTGELVEAKKARDIYTSIVQRTQDPGLLEYMGHKMFKMRVFPIPPKGDQKISFRYTSVVPKDHEMVNYTYPLKTDGKAIRTLEKFAINVNLKSQHSIQNIYSPTHAVTVTRNSDKEAKISFSKDEAALDRNFELFYAAGTKDVGLTALTHRPIANDKGYFLMLISPRAELSKEQQVPRDIVFVLDTSGSMRGKRIVQAKKALEFCLENLNKQDRFAVLHFATTVNKYTDKLLTADPDQLTQARKWVDQLEATGGTAINDALAAALQMRSKAKGRTFTVVFFTDGRPTIGETNTDKILQNVLKHNSANTRIFTFGVGDDVNATMLDQMSEQSRAVSTYVRESEVIVDKVSSLYNKISHPVLTNLKLAVTGDIKLVDVYPPQLPDLFHGSQLVVLGRFAGDGASAVRLIGNVGESQREFAYDMNFPKKTVDEKPFVEDLWARRKVGFLLDQIRRNGEKKELVDEVVTLSKRYGITTPYTSYLIVPDAPTPVASSAPVFRRNLPNVAFPQPPRQPGRGGFGRGRAGDNGGAKGGQGGKDKKGGFSRGGRPTAGAEAKKTDRLGVKEFAEQIKQQGGLAKNRGNIEEYRYALPNDDKSDKDGAGRALREAERQKRTFDSARQYFLQRDLNRVQNGKLGVDLSVWNNNLRTQSQVCRTAVRRINNRNVMEVGGVWIDENFDVKMKTITVKAMSKAYFRILARHPEVRDVYRLGNHLVWVTPSGSALIIDTIEGRDELSDAEIDGLFVARK